jgi:5,10-methylenetetrahydromethanopterin reductase
VSGDATLAVSCVFAPSLETPEHIALAETLGYRRAWCYDSPAMYADPWMTLARAADRTRTIGLGPATLVPSLRHPMVTAAALATLAGLAPGRVSAALGTGLTGRMLLGKRPMRWAEVASYLRAVQALLRGEETEWDGAVLRMLQPVGCAAARPVDVTILIAADGPRGTALAAELGDGVISTRGGKSAAADNQQRILLTFGSVLDADESPTDERVVAAAAPALAATYHAVYEARGAAGVDRLPGGPRWREAVEAVEPERRHLTIHDGHLLRTNPTDELFLPRAVHLLPSWTTTGTPAEVRARLDELPSAGITEVAYQPIGPDIDRELRAFADAAGLG